jgi:hypothetical protein
MGYLAPRWKSLGAIPRRADRDLVFGIGAGGYGGWSSAKARLDKVVNLKTPWRVHDPTPQPFALAWGR